MKKITYLLALVLLSAQTWAADIIVLKNSTRIDAKIIEVGEFEIKYKKANNLNGPTFVQKTDAIASIIYENGDVQSYANQQSAAPAAAAPATAAPKQTAAAPASGNEQAASDNSGNGKYKLKFNPQPSDHYWFGLTAGYVSKNEKASADGESETASFLLGRKGTTPAMRVGMTMNPTFKYGLGIRTGLFLEYGREVYSGRTAHDITLSVPAQISYRYEIIPKLSVMLYTGPIFDFGAYMGIQGDDTNYYGYKTDGSGKGYSGFNCLWGIGAGIQWDRLRLDLGGDFGMVNKSGESYYKLNWNKPFYITLTCLL